MSTAQSGVSHTQTGRRRAEDQGAERVRQECRGPVPVQQADRIHCQGAVGGEATEESGTGQEPDPPANAAVRAAGRQPFDQRFGGVEEIVLVQEFGHRVRMNE